MQLTVKVGNIDLVALLDSGSTHNFIAEEAAARAGVALQPRTGMNVLVANGDCLASSGRCRAMGLRIGEEYYNIDCYAIPLDSFDIVLDVKWLCTLGLIPWDFEHLQMSFTREGRRVTWHGLAAQHPEVFSLGCTGQDVMIELLDEFDNFFAEPWGLPPTHSQDHRIHLLPATEPIAVHPYRYAQHQKDELERQCDNMLNQGIIRRSSSTFSVHVLLV